VPEAVDTGRSPRRDALELGVLGGGNELVFIAEGDGEPGGAKVVALAYEHCGFEVGVPFDGLGSGKYATAERKVFFVKLLLECDCVGRDDELAALVDGLNDARQKVGEGFADARAGFEKQGFVGGHGGGDGAGHGFLLGAMFEVELTDEDTVIRK
jgi:hypothetical protein